jgi:predicted transcriptional regulator/tRNA A-37 threonylcarbamoyl transferase component Bud32
MSEENMDEETPGVMDRIQKEITMLEQISEVLEYILNHEPVGIVNISDDLGYPHPKARYSMRVLEEEGLIKSTRQGAVITDNASDEIEKYNQNLDNVQSQIASIDSEVPGLSIDIDSSSTKPDTADASLDEFLADASLDAVTDRFNSFNPLLEHDDPAVRQAAVKQLLKIAEDEPTRVMDLASILTIARLLRDEQPDICRTGFSLLVALVDYDPVIAEPVLPFLFDQLKNDDVSKSRYSVGDVFSEVAETAPGAAQDVIHDAIEKLPEASDVTRVDTVQSLNGVATTENGAKLLEPFTSDIIELLDDSNEDVRIPAARIVLVFTESDAVYLGRYEDQFAELLNDDSPHVRETVLKIIEHYTIDTDTISKIRQLAEEDPNEDVRTTALDLLAMTMVSETDSSTGAGMVEASTNSRSTDCPETTSSSSTPDPDKNETTTSTDEVHLRDRIPPASDVGGSTPVDLSYDQFEFDEETDLIGAGGQARVYRAEVPDENLTVALKQPAFNRTVSRDTYDRILNEARNWSRWDDHPHIVQVLDWGAEPGPWIALEYMDGGSLGEYIGTMSAEQRLWTAYAIVDAVAHANTKGLAHHDIKPNNILFRKTPDNKWDLPKVADWGLSREIIEATSSISQATPDYAAPEHFSALMPEAPVDERTDVYQLGVVCYEILTGTHPSHLRGEVPSPTEVNNSLPSSVDELINTAISHDRDKRFEHSILCKRELEAILSEDFPNLLKK